jgi:hypothetical protein
MKTLHKLTLPTLALALVTALPAFAQGPVPFPPGLAKKLAARASNYTEVTLDKSTLNFASQFMNKHDKNDQQAKGIINNLKGIYVRTYEFKQPGEYSAADLDRIRDQFRGPEWVPMVQSRSHSKGGLEISDIYQKIVDGESQGMLILNAEPKELDFVFISGHINPSELGSLGGSFGVPKLHVRNHDHGSSSASASNSNSSSSSASGGHQ